LEKDGDGRSGNVHDALLPLLLACALQKKGVVFNEIDITEEPERRPEMIQRAGGRTTVPQIFVDGEHIGGCDDLLALEREGKLDPKLGTV
jgi:glutaredoxin 3